MSPGAVGTARLSDLATGHEDVLGAVVVERLRQRIRASADLLGQSDEKSFGPPDVAEPIHVFVPDYFVDGCAPCFRSRASVSSRSSTANMTRR